MNALALREAADARPAPGRRPARRDGGGLDPGEGSEPYHYVYGREEWLLVLAGTPTLRHPQGEDQLEAGDLVCFPEGPAGAHRLLNRGESVVRALFLSTTGLPANVCYPDNGHWLIRNGLGRDDVVVRETDVSPGARRPSSGCRGAARWSCSSPPGSRAGSPPRVLPPRRRDLVGDLDQRVWCGRARSPGATGSEHGLRPSLAAEVESALRPCGPGTRPDPGSCTRRARSATGRPSGRACPRTGATFLRNLADAEVVRARRGRRRRRRPARRAAVQLSAGVAAGSARSCSPSARHLVPVHDLRDVAVGREAHVVELDLVEPGLAGREPEIEITYFQTRGVIHVRPAEPVALSQPDPSGFLIA